MKQRNIHEAHMKYLRDSEDGDDPRPQENSHPQPNADSPLSPPIGLEMETLGAQIDEPRQHDDLIFDSQNVSVELEAVETAFREHSRSEESELELASWLIHLSRILDSRDQPHAADAVRLRAKNIVEHELNELDGFDR